MLRSYPLPLAFLLLIVLTSGCADFGAFEIDYQSAETRVNGSPISPVLADALELDVPLEIDLASETAARDTGPAQHLGLTVFDLVVTPTAEPQGDVDDLAFIDSLVVYAESREPESSLPSVQIGVLERGGQATRRLRLRTDSTIDLLPYAREGARLRARAEGSLPRDDVSVRAQVTLLVDVL